MAEGLRATNSSSGVSVHQSVGSRPGHDTCLLKQALYHYCFTLRMGCKALGPMCCYKKLINAFKRPQYTVITKRRGSPQCVWQYNYFQSFEGCTQKEGRKEEVTWAQFYGTTYQ